MKNKTIWTSGRCLLPLGVYPYSPNPSLSNQPPPLNFFLAKALLHDKSHMRLLNHQQRAYINLKKGGPYSWYYYNPIKINLFSFLRKSLDVF